MLRNLGHEHTTSSLEIPSPPGLNLQIMCWSCVSWLADTICSHAAITFEWVQLIFVSYEEQQMWKDISASCC